MSLRTRLLLALLGLVAAGLLVAGFVTYSSLRSFLLERVDQQLREARGPVALTLASTQIPGLPEQGGPGQPNLPPGTYGELRSADGIVLNKISFAYGTETQPTPQLPSPLPGATVEVAGGTLFETDAAGGSGARFRVLVQDVPSLQRVLIVAVPLTETTQTLGSLVRIELPRVRARARRPRRGRLAAHQARPAAAGDHGRRRRRHRRRRPHAKGDAGRAAHGSGPARPQPQRHARPDRGGLRGARRH